MNHIKIDGQLRNLDKKWHHLSNYQKDWIFLQFREQYVNYLNNHKQHPDKSACYDIVRTVYNLIEDRGIWISFSEVNKAFSGKLARYRKIKL